ncbi:MAG: acyl-CoA desaturase [Actinobacteria bacterium]|nr:acyl-CoA desaturase [Actinomycetota bacterium]
MSSPVSTATPARTPRSKGAPVVRAEDDKIYFWPSLPFFLVNLSPLLVLFTGLSWKSVALLAVTFWGRMFFITAGYHRYFSHRTYRLARVPQFLMAFGGTTAAQKGPLWWASHHRNHHRFSDTDQDVHSPQKGFWWSHVLWIVCEKYAATRHDRIKDFAKYPELRFLDKYDWIGPWMLGMASYLIDGWRGLVVGFFTSTVLLWHSTFFINSLAHVFGRRRYATEDTSRNSFLLALLTMGEGWHNNHHYQPSACRNGFYWWEWDPTFYLLKALSLVGIVKDMKRVPRWARDANHVKDGSFDIGMFRLSWNKAARTLQAASAHVGELVHDKRANAGEALAEKRHAVEEGIHQHKATLEQFVHSSMESAEELARATRRGNREIATEPR